jgi:two-component system sensor histidine kinase GlrK
MATSRAVRRRTFVVRIAVVAAFGCAVGQHKVRFPREISSLQLVASGFVVAVAPLVAAVVIAAVQVERLAEQSRASVLTAEMATQQSRALLEHVTAMERSFGQYAVLGDRDLYRTYAERRESFLLASATLAGLDLGADVRGRLADLAAAEASLHDRIMRTDAGPGDVAALAADFAALAGRARRVTAESRAVVLREANGTRDAAARLQQLLVVLAATAIPAALGLALVAIMLINRPLAAIKRALARLGGGDFRTPVRVRGPQDLEELGEQLDWLRRRTVELETAKLEFLRQVSHDLKTPLSSIREGAELLEEDPAGTRERAEIVRIIRESSLRLQDLIEGLLQFQRVAADDETGRSRVMGPVRLTELIEQVLGKHRLTLRAKDLTISMHVPDIVAQADPLQLATVLDNIISNAIKYSPRAGSIRVSARDESGRAIVEVEDDGPGVAADERQRVFDPFYQGRARGSARVGSTGLGLAIVKRLIEANGGTVEFLDCPSGARVRASLPAVSHG